MTKFTKGPLKINTVFNSKGIAIPKVFDSKGPLFILVDGLKSERENLNIAHLIAAAPEMFECIATIYNLSDLQPLLEAKYSKALVNDLMKMMDNAIKKARGES